MQASYVYEDKYLTDAGKVSAVDMDSPDYDAHPNMQHLKVSDVTVEKGDILYIPVYWWHQVRSVERSIGITKWFDPWGLASIVGSGRGRRTDHNLGILKAWLSDHTRASHAKKTWTSCTKSKPIQSSCRVFDNICRQNPMRHHFCPSAGHRASPTGDKERLVQQLFELGKPEKMTEELMDLANNITQENTRTKINWAMTEIVSCGEPLTRSSQASEDEKMVAKIGSRLYFENNKFLDLVKDSVDANKTIDILKGFHIQESHRILHDLFHNYDREFSDSLATEKVTRLLAAAAVS